MYLLARNFQTNHLGGEEHGTQPRDERSHVEDANETEVDGQSLSQHALQAIRELLNGKEELTGNHQSNASQHQGSDCKAKVREIGGRVMQIDAGEENLIKQLWRMIPIWHEPTFVSPCRG